MTSLETIAAIKKQASAATEGPWYAQKDDLGMAEHLEIMREHNPEYLAEYDVLEVRCSPDSPQYGLFVASGGCHKDSEANTAFIAASRTNVVNLCKVAELTRDMFMDVLCLPPVKGPNGFKEALEIFDARIDEILESH